ncbi:hypothetical protein [Methylorubrum suomiense]|uniref:Uncharacterized protein n=1 Tax=Methylorubrum suomiense TaxID=144191 RepID=A0ABQ4UPH7_9HYPH|nr:MULTISPECIES: hypothetical protein [Methylobacteriaceae]GJE73709.1 hypothetical protein BGCPKDLD_0276 [Methylorubrum suomiense]
MTDTDRTRPSLKEFDAYADRNGQDFGTASPLDVGIPSRTQADLKGNPDGTAEAARIASGTPGQDATDQTEAETPPENMRRISDPSFTPSPTPSGPDAAAAEAIERATAAVGSEEAPRQGGRDGQ